MKGKSDGTSWVSFPGPVTPCRWSDACLMCSFLAHPLLPLLLPSAAVAFLLVLYLPHFSSCLKLWSEFFTNLSSKRPSLATPSKLVTTNSRPRVTLNYISVLFSLVSLFEIIGFIHVCYLFLPSQHPPTHTHHNVSSMRAKTQLSFC